MGRKDRGNIWSSTASKPKGFTFVKGESMTYTYEVPIVTNALGQNSWNKTTIDRIFIKMKVKNTGELGYAYTTLDIDKEYIDINIKNEIGKDVEFDYEDHCFIRDGRMFPFVTSITIYFNCVEKYRQHRLLKARKEKLLKLKNKLI